MVLLSGLEPPTSPLPRECSTTELQQQWACLIRPPFIMQGSTFAPTLKKEGVKKEGATGSGQSSWCDPRKVTG